MNRTIIQLVGESGSGQTESAKHLSKYYGLVPLEVKGIISDWADYEEIELWSRKNYLEAHAQMVSEAGRLAVTDAILDSPYDRICIDGGLVPANASLLRTYGVIIALDCPLEIRHPRLMRRGGRLDRISLEDLRDLEKEESANTDPYTQNTRAVMKDADFHINSSQPLPWVRRDLDRIIAPNVVNESLIINSAFDREIDKEFIKILR